MFLKRNREALQGCLKIVKGRDLLRMFLLFLFFLWTAQNLEELQTDHWLRNRQNAQGRK